jgi:hypothetical protein
VGWAAIDRISVEDLACTHTTPDAGRAATVPEGQRRREHPSVERIQAKEDRDAEQVDQFLKWKQVLPALLTRRKQRTRGRVDRGGGGLSDTRRS